MKTSKSKSLLHILMLHVVFVVTSCAKFVEGELPQTELIKSTVFSSDNTAKAAAAGIYAQIGSYATGGSSSVSITGDLSADGLIYNTTGGLHFQFNTHSLLPSTATILFMWSDPYKNIYRANDMLVGLAASTGVTQAVKQQLTGEALFIRGFAYHYLVEQFGDVPLVLSTDYRVSGTAGRSPKIEVYKQISADLIAAKSLLSNDYGFSNGEKVRANKWVASALLARVYLYAGQYELAEQESDSVIKQVTLYSLEPLQNVFLKNSKEAIWQIGNSNNNTEDARQFVIPTTGAPTGPTLSNSLVSSFEDGDDRKLKWTTNKTFNGTIYNFPMKYKAYSASPVTEYSMVLRLAEQYLIRAEAQIKLGRVTEGIQSLNTLRTRARAAVTASIPAPLPPLPLTLTESDAMLALEQERRSELFSEWGHRWFDLKRWPSRITPGDIEMSRADDLLNIKPGWRKERKLYPIPESQIANDPMMAEQQNPGYN